MKLLAIGTWDPRRPADPGAAASRTEPTAELREEGFLQQLLLRADGTGGFLILDSESADSARERLGTFPFVRHGVMSIELVELS